MIEERHVERVERLEAKERRQVREINRMKVFNDFSMEATVTDVK